VNVLVNTDQTENGFCPEGPDKDGKAPDLVIPDDAELSSRFESDLNGFSERALPAGPCTGAPGTTVPELQATRPGLDTAVGPAVHPLCYQRMNPCQAHPRLCPVGP